jgi:hypothetical protein
MYNDFETKVSQVIDHHAPIKYRYPRKNSVPYMNRFTQFVQFLNSKIIYKGNVHPILKHKYFSALNIDRIPIKLRIVTGTYVLQAKRIKFYRDESDPTCLLCGNATTEFHFDFDIGLSK